MSDKRRTPNETEMRADCGRRVFDRLGNLLDSITILRSNVEATMMRPSRSGLQMAAEMTSCEEATMIEEAAIQLADEAQQLLAEAMGVAAQLSLAAEAASQVRLSLCGWV